MPKAQCTRCINVKFYIDADTDESECVECGRKFSSGSRIRELVIKQLEKEKKKAQGKFLLHDGDF